MRLDHDVLPHGLEHAEREKTPVVARLQADLPVWARVKETGVNTTEPCRQYTLTLGQALMPAGWSVERRIMRHACTVQSRGEHPMASQSKHTRFVPRRIAV